MSEILVFLRPGPWRDWKRELEESDLPPEEYQKILRIYEAIKGGWGNGYVALPKGHPWYGLDCYDIPAQVHGGLTYGGEEEVMISQGIIETRYVIGFDTLHARDTRENCPEEYVRAEAESLKQQAIEAWERAKFAEEVLNNINKDAETDRGAED